jgi:hypothetical protein
MTLRTQASDSELYQTIADVARFLEANTTKDHYGFLDGGTTLEISVELIEACRQLPEWQELERRYEQVNGNIYSPDSYDLEGLDWY